MYQLVDKIYNNEIEVIETKLSENVYLISHVYKFVHNDKNKKWLISIKKNTDINWHHKKYKHIWYMLNIKMLKYIN